MPSIAIIAPGAMGSAVGQRLAGNGIDVVTVLDGRSPASAARARQAGMRAVDGAALADVGLILSIVPPAEALPLAERLAPTLAAAARKPVYADCNAVSPQSVERIAAVIGATGAPFADAGIIGGPPRPGEPGPVFYGCGPGAEAMAQLDAGGIRFKRLDGPIGAASGLKMSYAGITKGMTALGTAMILAASRFGAADDLRAELADSQAALLARFTRAIPDMYPKAYRWVAEMEEIAAFASEDPATREVFEGIARFYARIAADGAGPKAEIATLNAFLGKQP